MSIIQLERAYAQNITVSYFHERTDKIVFFWGSTCKNGEKLATVSYDPHTHYIKFHTDDDIIKRWKIDVTACDTIATLDPRKNEQKNVHCLWMGDMQVDVDMFFYYIPENLCFACTVNIFNNVIYAHAI